MRREFDIGDAVICKLSGVVGKIIKFYTPTSCAEQTLILTNDGREYHAPTSEFVKYMIGVDLSPIEDATGNLLNPYGEYVCKFAANHVINMSEAYERPIVRAIYDYYCKTGCPTRKGK